MKKLIFIICATTCCTLLASWHSWDTPPEKDQLYMFVDLEFSIWPEHRQILIITHYDKHNPLCRLSRNGWWDAGPYDILKWCREGSKVLYCPTGIDKEFTRRLEDLLTVKDKLPLKIEKPD